MWPPPATCTASTGFQPTKAAARAGRGATRATATTATTIPTAASALKSHAATSDESPDTSATGSESNVNAGPYTVVRSRQSAPRYGAAGLSGEVRRRIDVRVPAALRPDPAVAPVRPGVRREEERRGERDELDRDGEHDDQSRRSDRATEERESRDVGDERGREEDREGPRCSLVGGPAVARDERRAVLPGKRARTGDENEGGGSGREGALHAAIIADYGSSGCAGLEGGPPVPPTPLDELAPPPPPDFFVPVAGAFPSSPCFASSSSGSAGVGGV